MKLLLLMRHAKSSWAEEHTDDFDRPLNKRGRHDAPRMGQLLAAQDIAPQRIVCSAARRAAETAANVASASGFEGPLELTQQLYLAPPAAYLQIAARQDDSCDRLLLIGHNPGIGELVSQLSQQYREMPTTATAVFQLPIQHWSDLPATAELAQFWTPADLDDLDL